MNKIAIDVTSVPNNPAGIGNYILNLTQSISKLMKSNKQDLFIFGRSDQKTVREFNCGLFIDCGIMNRAKRIIWEQAILPKLLIKHSISLLHSPNYTIPLFTSCKRVSTIHDLTCFLFPERRPSLHSFYFRTMMKFTARYADCIVSVSQNTKKDIEKYLKKLNCPVKVVFEGCSPVFKKLKSEDVAKTLLQFNITKPYFLFVGTIEPSKNLLRLIRSFKKFHNKIPNPTELLLVGKLGWNYKDILNEIQNSDDKIIIKYLGYQPNEIIAPLYNGALCFVYPSLYEGFGIPPLEAMSCGTPVVCSNISSIPEVTGDAALLFNPYDSDEILNALQKIYSDNQLRSFLIQKGFKRIKLFLWDKIAQDIYNIYLEILNSGHNIK